MRIVPYPNFQHAGSLRGYMRDPRDITFNESHIDVDLRVCEFVRAPAVLWCVIYPLLSSYMGSKCSVLVPENIGVCIYLKSLGLFQILHDNGIDADDRGIGERSDSKSFFP